MQTECSAERASLDGSRVGPLWRSSTAARDVRRGRPAVGRRGPTLGASSAGLRDVFVTRESEARRALKRHAHRERVFGIALGYEDLNDHDELRHDPLMAALAADSEARREDRAPVAGKSTLNRLELSRETPTKYRKIAHEPAAIEALFVDLFVEAHARAPRQIILDLDATGRPAARPSGRPLLSRLL